MDGPGSFPARCSWCGAEKESPTAEFCATCAAPTGRIGHVLFVLNFLAKNLLIPGAIVVMSLWFTARQQTSDRAIADHQKLIEAYIDFAKAHSDFRIAESEISILALNTGTVKFNDLKGAVLRLDQAFDSIGAKLTQFEDSEKSLPGFVTRFPGGKTDVEEIWQDCFILPYYADPQHGSSYFNEIGSQLRPCNSDTCPSDSARGIQRAIEKIESGHCFDGPLSGKDYQFTWFWGALERIISKQPAQQQDDFIN
jgi:hypothetical protein